MKKQKLITRLYRVSTEDDVKVKKMAKKYGGESAYIRALIREGVIVPSDFNEKEKAALKKLGL